MSNRHVKYLVGEHPVYAYNLPSNQTKKDDLEYESA